MSQRFPWYFHGSYTHFFKFMLNNEVYANLLFWLHAHIFTIFFEPWVSLNFEHWYLLTEIHNGREGMTSKKVFFTVKVILNYIDLCCCCFFRIKIIYFLKFILWHWLWIYHILCHYVGWIISNDCISPEFFFQLYLFWLLLHASSSLILFSEFLIQIWVGPTLSP